MFYPFTNTSNEKLMEIFNNLKKSSGDSELLPPFCYKYNDKYVTSTAKAKFKECKLYSGVKFEMYADFELHCPNDRLISHDRIYYYEVYIYDTQSTHSEPGDYPNGIKLIRTYHNFYPVFRDEDMKGIYLILFQRTSSPLKNTVYIYKNFELFHVLNNVLFLADMSAPAEDDIVFFRLKDGGLGKYYYNLVDNEECSENAILSLDEWCNHFGDISVSRISAVIDGIVKPTVMSANSKHLRIDNKTNLKHYYCDDNPPIDDISWNDDIYVNWKCVNGHSFSEKISEITKFACLTEDICPYCRRKTDESIFPESQVTGFINKMDILSFGEKIMLAHDYVWHYLVDGQMWVDQDDWPKEIHVKLNRRSGKDGDVEYYISKRFGSIYEENDLYYYVVFQTKDYEVIDLIYYAQILYANYAEEKFEGVGPIKDISDLIKLKDNFYLPRIINRLSNIGPSRGTYHIRKIDKKLRHAVKIKSDSIYQQIVEEGLTTPKWTSEYSLYLEIKHLYPDAVHQYQPDWLNLQSLDIYIPSRSLAIEYQGLQHYEPVEFFGGAEAYLANVERDKKKRVLCNENGVTLALWKYDVEINSQSVKEFLRRC